MSRCRSGSKPKRDAGTSAPRRRSARSSVLLTRTRPERGDQPRQACQRSFGHRHVRLQVELQLLQRRCVCCQGNRLAQRPHGLAGQLAPPAQAQLSHLIGGRRGHRSLPVSILLQEAIMQQGEIAVAQRVDVDFDETRAGIQAVTQPAQGARRIAMAATGGVMNESSRRHTILLVKLAYGGTMHRSKTGSRPSLHPEHTARGG